MMGEPAYPEQLFAPGFRTRSGETASLPSQMLEMPAVGWVLAHHARGISVAVAQQSEGDGPDAVMLLLYEGGPGEAAGHAHFTVIGLEHARAHAHSILRACDMIEAGISLAGCTRRAPPAAAR